MPQFDPNLTPAGRPQPPAFYGSVYPNQSMNVGGGSSSFAPARPPGLATASGLGADGWAGTEHADGSDSQQPRTSYMESPPKPARDFIGPQPRIKPFRITKPSG